MRKLATKEELSERLNAILSLEDTIDFTKLTKEDLERLVKVVEDPSRLIQTGVKQLREKARREILERPLKELMDKPFIEGLLERDADKGPLGLGILPRILGKSKE